MANAIPKAIASWQRFRIALTILLFSSPANAVQTSVYEFSNSLEGWSWQWHIDNGGPSVRPGEVALSNERGFNDSSSLKFDMGSGTGDDGTLWIEKQFSVPAGIKTPVSVSFQLYSTSESFVNNFQVKAYIGVDDPQQQRDLQTIGQTNLAAGWMPYSLSSSILAPEETVWVALGIRVSWETHRDYWIDHVTVTTVPEPRWASVLSLLVALFFRVERNPRARVPAKRG